MSYTIPARDTLIWYAVDLDGTLAEPVWPDPESGLPHLAHAGFHILSLLTFASGEQYAVKDDRA